MARKQKQYHFIYKTVNQVNGKWYMGMHSTDNLEDGYIGSGKRLWYSIRKYGRENFKMEILEFLPDRRSLKEREKEIVNEGLLQDPMCMNLAVGGEGGFRGEEATKKWYMSGQASYRKKLENESYKETVRHHHIDGYEKFKMTGFYQVFLDKMKKRLGKDNPFYGKTHTEEFKENMKNRMKNIQKGEKNSQFGMKWIHNLELKQCKRIKKDEQIPDGWKSGRKMKF